jgi:hypothetical protein
MKFQVLEKPNIKEIYTETQKNRTFVEALQKMVALGQISKVLFNEARTKMTIICEVEEVQIIVPCGQISFTSPKDLLGFNLKEIKTNLVKINDGPDGDYCYSYPIAELFFFNRAPVPIFSTNFVDNVGEQLEFQIVYKSQLDEQSVNTETEPSSTNVEQQLQIELEKDQLILDKIRNDIANLRVQMLRLESDKWCAEQRQQKVLGAIKIQKKKRDIETQRCGFCDKHPRCAVKLQTNCDCSERHCLTCVRDKVMSQAQPRGNLMVSCFTCKTSSCVDNVAHRVYTVDNEYNKLLDELCFATDCPRDCGERISFSGVQTHLSNHCRKSMRIKCSGRCKKMMCEDDRKTHIC